MAAAVWVLLVLLFLYGKRPDVSWSTYLLAGFDYWRAPEKYLRDGWHRFPWLALVAWIAFLAGEIIVANVHDLSQ